MIDEKLFFCIKFLLLVMKRFNLELYGSPGSNGCQVHNYYFYDVSIEQEDDLLKTSLETGMVEGHSFLALKL